MSSIYMIIGRVLRMSIHFVSFLLFVDVLRKLARILIAFILNDDDDNKKLVGLLGRYSDLSQSSDKTIQLVCSMYIRILHNLMSGCLNDHTSLINMEPNCNINPPTLLSSIIEFLCLGISPEADEVWLLKHIFVHALRPTMAFPRFSQQAGWQSEDSSFKVTCVFLSAFQVIFLIFIYALNVVILTPRYCLRC